MFFVKKRCDLAFLVYSFSAIEQNVTTTGSKVLTSMDYGTSMSSLERVLISCDLGAEYTPYTRQRGAIDC